MDEKEWLTSKESADVLGIKPPNFHYYVKMGDVEWRQGKRSKEYRRTDVLKLKRELRSKTQRTPPEEVIIDWLYAEDVPAGLKLSMSLYHEEVDLAEASIYQSWRRHNQHLTMAAFSLDRNTCFASVQVVPLPETVILDVLSGKRTEGSILPDEVLPYDAPGSYNLLVTSATCDPKRKHLLQQVLRRYMDFWLDQYPERYPRHIYAQAVSEDGMKVVQHFFMSPLLSIATNAFLLDLSYPPVSKIVQRFKNQLAEKAPLPEDLHWHYVDPTLSHLSQNNKPVATRTPAIVYNINNSSSEKPVRSTIPDGSVILRHFNDKHNMKDTTVGRRIRDKVIDVTTGEWQHGRQRVTQILTQEQQHHYWQSLHTEPGFSPCTDCPHSTK